MATEKRLIDVNALKKAILAEPWKDQPNTVRLTVDYINIIVDEQPTVDAVEVVRCKGCFANGCCSVQIDLDMGDEGYCPKGRKEN